MSNICAGIGRGQLKVLDKRIEKKTGIYNKYKNELEKVKEIKMQPIPKNTMPNHWLSVMTIDKDSKVKPLNIMETLEKENIDSRPVWKPMHLQPVFKEYDFITAKNDGTSVSEDLFNRGVCLPSDTKMTEEEQERVIDIIKKCFEHNVRKIHKTNIRLNIKSNGINSINAINDNYWNISKNKPRKSYNIQTKKTREKRKNIYTVQI